MSELFSCVGNIEFIHLSNLLYYDIGRCLQLMYYVVSYAGFNQSIQVATA